MPHPHHRLISNALAAVALLAAAALPLRAQDAGTREILITYRCRPADRPAFRAYLATHETRMLDNLKADGTLRDYQVLFNPVVTETFDALLVLDFTTPAATQRWLAIERTSPGGLSPAGLRLATPQMTYFADLQWQGTGPTPAGEHPVFYVIPYSYNSIEQYKGYIDAYLIPQVQGWLKDGVLSRYAIYLNRYPVGPPWDALFIYEYRDAAAFGEREHTIAKVRATLRSSPSWLHWSDMKFNLRTEGENTIMEEITAPYPAARATTAPHQQARPGASSR